MVNFIRQAWSVIEPGAEYVHGWHIDAIAQHLEAVEDGDITRLLINVPPGMMKSLATSVFWPAWIWGPKNKPHYRFLCASHSQALAIRDSTKMRRLIQSDWYQERWGDRVILTGDQNAKTKFENTATGFREAVAAGSITGSRGDVVIIDDPHSVESASSDAMRETTKEWFLEAVPTRLNIPEKSAIVVIMQRLHEEDISGIILEKELGYEHLCLPMEFESVRRCETSIGFVDERDEEGQLLFPERFPIEVVERDKAVLGPYAAAGQFQQSPTPRGGGIIKTEWWKLWNQPSYPQFSYIVAALDTAYTEKQENDPSAMTVWGVFAGLEGNAQPTRSIQRDGSIVWDLQRQYSESHPRVLLLDAWTERLELYDLVEKVRQTMEDYQVDNLLIENKAAGHSVAQELRRVYGHERFGVQLMDPKGLDKVSRVYSIQHLFSEGMIYAPDINWADQVITQAAQFPKAKHDDLVDTVSMALGFLRKSGMLIRNAEWTAELDTSRTHSGAPPPPLYPA